MENVQKAVIEKLQETIKAEKKKLREDEAALEILYVNYYDNCPHFKAVAHYDEDSCEGRRWNYCRCIRCGLDEMLVEYPYRDLDDEKMVPYLDKYAGRIPGFESSTNFNYWQIKSIFNQALETNPNITNKELEEILIKKEEEINKANELDSGVSRTRN